MPSRWFAARHWQRIEALANQPVVHGNNGWTLNATKVLAMLDWLGIKPS